MRSEEASVPMRGSRLVGLLSISTVTVSLDRLRALQPAARASKSNGMAL